MTDEESRIAPAMLFRSFLVVAGAYVSSIILLFVVASIAFPEPMSIVTGEPEAFNKIMETDPERIVPPSMFVVLLVAAAVICFGLGYLVPILVPIGKFSHAIFFAAVLFAQYLQLAIGANSNLQSKLILFMAVTPIAALLGANLAMKRFIRQVDPSD